MNSNKDAIVEVYIGSRDWGVTAPYLAVNLLGKKCKD